MAAITVLFLLVSILGLSSALPSGAPDMACVNLLPAATAHGPGSTAASPYTFMVEGLLSANGRYYYQPGRTYNVTLRGTASSTQFRGFLVQLRLAADGLSIVSDQLADAENTGLIRQHSCTPATGGFTHTSNVDKNYIRFQWTPRAGSGALVFRYTVVQTRMMHWDALSSDTIYEDLPRCMNSSYVDRAFVYWTARNASLNFILRFNTTANVSAAGYYGAIGFSMNNIMPMTDIVVGALYQNSSFVDDRFATARAMPPRDANQNLLSYSVSIVNGLYELNFERPLTTGDSNDFDLNNNNLNTNCFYLLVAFGPVTDFNANTIGRHTYRAVSTRQYCFCPSGAGMITGLSVWLLLMIAAVQYLL